MPGLAGFGDGLAVVEDLCRLEACLPPHVPVPRKGPCPKKSLGGDVAKAVKKAVPKPKAEPKPKAVAKPKAVPKPKAAKKAQALAAPAGGPGTGRDITAAKDVDLGKIMSLRKLGPDGSDHRLAEMAKLQGFDGVPETGSAAALSEAIRGGGVEMFRGVEGVSEGPAAGMSSAKVSEAFRSGSVYYGYGQLGNGIYTSASRSDAKSYSDNKPGSVSRMVLKPGARVATRGELQVMMRDQIPPSFEGKEAELELAQRQWMTPGNSAAKREDARVRMNRLRDEIAGSPDQIYRDLSAFAMAKGFDAVRMPGGTNGTADNYILLNRSAVLSERSGR